MKWAQRVFSGFIIAVVAYVVYELAVQHNSIDPALIAAITLAFNVCIYFIGRSDVHEEQVQREHSSHTRVLHSSDCADPEPSDHGAVHGPGNEEHPDISQGSG